MTKATTPPAVAVFAALLFLTTPTWAADYSRDVRPLLASHCFRCHGSQKQKGSLDLERFLNVGQVVADLKAWRSVSEMVATGKMPPEGARPLDAAQRRQITDWIAAAIRQAETAAPSDPGPSLPRRLTRREYARAIRDIFNVSVDVETYLPEPRSTSGYDNQAAQLKVAPELLEKYLLLADRVLDAAYPNIYNTRQKEPIKSWFTVWEGENKTTARAAAEQNLRGLARVAFRRPPEDREIRILLGLFDQAYKQKKNWHESLRFAIKGLLVSPQFLFRTEALPDHDRPVPVEEYELAARLAFFLWSSVPDNELLTLAAAGRLHQSEVLRAQIKRMRLDPRVRGLTADFPPQWLFGRLAQHRLDPVLFPDYVPALARAAEDELAVYFEKLIQESRSLVELIDSDYTYVNEDLAPLYGIKNIQGPQMRRVLLTDHRRGGLAGMAIVHQKTSMPNRTSPTIRGKWVLDSLLGMPPPPPPPTVNNTVDSQAANEQGKALTFREKLALHARQGSACLNCHRKMDPLGFALEDFDALGRTREKDNGRPIENTGKMPDGTQLKGAVSVKKVLLERREQFLRNLVEHLLTYALGRDLQPYDLPTVRRITETVKQNGYRADVLIDEIVLSYPFLHKRAPRAAEVPGSTPEKR